MPGRAKECSGQRPGYQACRSAWSRSDPLESRGGGRQSEALPYRGLSPQVAAARGSVCTGPWEGGGGPSSATLLLRDGEMDPPAPGREDSGLRGERGVPRGSPAAARQVSDHRGRRPGAPPAALPGGLALLLHLLSSVDVFAQRLGEQGLEL